MATEISKLKMRTANNRPQKMPITTMHIGTTDFYRPSIVEFTEVVPGEHVKLDTIISIQGKPMAMPAEVQLQHSLRAFYVPQRVISKDWNSFITGVPFRWRNNQNNEVLGIHDEDMFIDNMRLIEIFFDPANEYMTHNGIYTDHDISMTWINPNNDEIENTYHRFTTKGKQFYNILCQIGCEINWVARGNFNIDGYKKENYMQGTVNIKDAISEGYLEQDKMSFKPIMAVIKMMYDWYVPSQYENYYQDMFETMKERHNMNDTFLNQDTVSRMFDVFTFVAYKAGYFTSAWQNPNGPNENIETVSVEDPTIPGRAIYRNTVKSEGNNQDTKGTPVLSYQGKAENTPKGITAYALRALDAIQNYVTRNRIAGYRPIDRFLAQFGIHLDYIQTGRSNYLGSNTINLNITQVIAQAETAGTEAEATGAADQQLLGGKGAVLSGLNKLHTEWKVEEHGYIIVVQTIIPREGYYQGLKPWFTRTNKLAYYNPTFDNLGTEAIPRKLLFHSLNVTAGESNADDVWNTYQIDIASNPSQIWGWSGTYMTYKVGFDTLSGDFRIKSLATGIDSMHSLRIIGKNTPASINKGFMIGEQKQYDRLFAYTADDIDHIYFTAVRKHSGTKPMKSSSESMELTDGEGNYTEFEVGGSYMN